MSKKKQKKKPKSKLETASIIVDILFKITTITATVYTILKGKEHRGRASTREIFSYLFYYTSFKTK